ncbi:MAG: FAD-binding oxidoreductase [Myxococcota bacterium]|nr:FAD-binding oxidoreductase [Myxococcota bacterium]
MADRYDVIIIGAGLIGSSIAWRLVNKGCKDVALLDIDLAGLFSSSELGAGGVRATWGRGVDLDLARASLDFYETIREEVGFRQRGYLWLHDGSTWPTVANNPRLRHRTHEVQLLTTAELQQRFPEIDKVEGLLGATFSPKDGLVNANLLKQYYRARAKAGGATLLDHHMVTGVQVVSSTEIALQVATFEAEEDAEEDVEEIYTSLKPPAEASERVLRCTTLINATGAWGGTVAAHLGDTPPIRPVRRQISLVYSRDANLRGYGMIVVPGGLYCHPEAGHTLCGWRDPTEKEGFSFKYGNQSYFLKEILPRLSSRISGFERTRHMGGWTGLVAETPDGSAVIGQVPDHPNIYEAIGFAGKGVTQSYAAGVCVADLVLHGRYLELDASPLSRKRFEAGGTPLEDDALIL